MKIGAASEIEMRDTMERVDDALNATRAAMDLGVIEGGGFTLANMKDSGQYRHSFFECLNKPYYQILANAGGTNVNTIIPLNAKTGMQVDLLEEGIIDPVKVTLSSLNSAASVAALVLTSEVLVGELDEV